MDASCQNTYDKNSNAINSPNYPSKYPNEKYCTWKVTAPIGTKIRVERFNYSLESESDCKYDNLKFYDGTSTSSERLAELCGNNIYGGITSAANNLFFAFKSDGSVTRTGFQIAFSIIGMKINLSISTKTNLINIYFDVAFIRIT